MGLNSAEEGYFNGFDGTELFYQTWSHSQPKAVILGIHGLGEHSGSYKLLAEGLQNSPCQLIMSDLRGHGRSEGKRGVGSIDEYILDIKIFMKTVAEQFRGIPIFLMGHSMGGLILLKFLIRNGPMGALGAILSSPLLGVTVEVSAFKKKSAGLLAKLTPSLTMANEIPNENLTHYKPIIEAFENDHWRHDRISPRLYTEMISSMAYVNHQSAKIQGPILFQVAGADLVVSRKDTEAFFRRLQAADKEEIIYENYYHEIYNEVWREKPYADLMRWIDRHRQGATK